MNWSSEETSIQFNPKKYSLEEQQIIRDLLPVLPAHIWIESSGTTGVSKWIALSKKAFLVSADAVNQHLSATADDRWLCALPTFHVGGLSIFARAERVGASVVSIADARWNGLDFYSILFRENITLTSLVPTQIYDLVQENIPAPEKLRAVIIGGAALSSDLYLAARRLGWPLLPSFGMTECCSQIATASLQSIEGSEYPALEILQHVQLRLDAEGCLEVRSEALATLVARIEGDQVIVEDPKRDGFWPTRDQVEIFDGKLRFLQRLDEVVKIAGEQVSLAKLNALFKTFITGQVEMIGEEQLLIATPSERWGAQIDLVTTKQQFARLEPQLEKFNQQLLPFERVQNIYFVEALPRTELGKIKTQEVLRQLGLA